MKAKPFYESRTFWLPLFAIAISILAYIGQGLQSDEGVDGATVLAMVCTGLAAELGAILGRMRGGGPLTIKPAESDE